ncbi:hypothetical protein A2W24_01725 [Microgenomates group bacterium RBG_16_45_19]|nr:MAG: hypothetical protein A2W24_01725 [Microgenomates group bacterium RBG_16_45_19]
MRKVIFASLFVVLGLAVGISLSESQKTVKNANWWNQMEDSEKVDYVGGFWNGVTWSDAVVKDALSHFKTDGRIDQSLHDEIFNKWIDYTDIGTTSVGSIVDRLDSFYDNPLNSELTIEEAMDIVVFNIQGLPLSDATVQNLLKTYRDSHQN